MKFLPLILSNLRRSVEHSLEDGRITFEESALIYRRYESGLHGYTYLTRERKPIETALQPQPAVAKSEA
jgi:hypothetical protein